MNDFATDNASFFPENEDLELIQQSQKLHRFVAGLTHWLGEFAGQRKAQQLEVIRESEELVLLQSARDARNLMTSSSVPVAAAIYGPSQVGKSLLIGRVLTPRQAGKTALGRDEVYADQPLSFEDDLNPNSGENEATALVTRFTTADRMPRSISPEFPVMVRALSRAQWLAVLGRGFQIECSPSSKVAFNAVQLEQVLADLRKESGLASSVPDRDWVNDLLHVYTYLQPNDDRKLVASESELNGLLARYPLSPAGCVRLAAVLFWDEWGELTELFVEVDAFLNEIRREIPADEADAPLAGESAIMTDWRSVKFLLDSSRLPSNAGVRWDDLIMARDESSGWYLLGRDVPHSKRGGKSWDLAIVQSAMLEMVIPVLPSRLTDYWKEILMRMDVLDVPGMRAGASGPEEGKRTNAKKIDHQMEIVKRGKVAFLFERYTEEKLIQTLLLLNRGGNLEVSGYMKAHINRWGRSRYGENWPAGVNEKYPALLIGLTGIDTEFRNREEQDDLFYSELYNKRLENYRNALSPVLDEFGGGGFRNAYVLRYPGTWDALRTEWSKPELIGRWEAAGRGFTESSELVKKFVHSPAQRWQAAMEDDDGGVSLVSECINNCTTADGKRQQLADEIKTTWSRVATLALDWHVDTAPLKERRRRTEHASKVLKWLYQDRVRILDRVEALTEGLCIKTAEYIYLADLTEVHIAEHLPSADALNERISEAVRDCLTRWAKIVAPRQWEQFMQQRATQHGGRFEEIYGVKEFGAQDFSTLTRYLQDFLCSETQFEKLLDKLRPIITLTMTDESVLFEARRRCVGRILNDFLTNPGAGIGAMPAVQDVEESLPEDVTGGFGVMSAFVARWRSRLPEALASGAGTHMAEPPGNAQLGEILAGFGIQQTS